MDEVKVDSGAHAAQLPPGVQSSTEMPESDGSSNVLSSLRALAQDAEESQDWIAAVSYLERAVVVSRHLYGSNSKEVELHCQSACSLYNRAAMAVMQADCKFAWSLLQKAQVLAFRQVSGANVRPQLQLQAMTANNLGCFFQHRGKLRAALRWLSTAHSIEARNPGISDNVASTHLNLCAVLSALGRHEDALEQAHIALSVLNETAQQLEHTQSADVGHLVAVAWHNTAVELEYLERSEESINAYNEAVVTAEQTVGHGDPFTLAMRSSLQTAVRDRKAKLGDPKALKAVIRENRQKSMQNDRENSKGVSRAIEAVSQLSGSARYERRELGHSKRRTQSRKRGGRNSRRPNTMPNASQSINEFEHLVPHPPRSARELQRDSLRSQQIGRKVSAPSSMGPLTSSLSHADSPKRVPLLEQGYYEVDSSAWSISSTSSVPSFSAADGRGSGRKVAFSGSRKEYRPPYERRALMNATFNSQPVLEQYSGMETTSMHELARQPATSTGFLPPIRNGVQTVGPSTAHPVQSPPRHDQHAQDVLVQQSQQRSENALRPYTAPDVNRHPFEVPFSQSNVLPPRPPSSQKTTTTPSTNATGTAGASSTKAAATPGAVDVPRLPLAALEERESATADDDEEMLLDDDADRRLEEQRAPAADDDDDDADAGHEDSLGDASESVPSMSPSPTGSATPSPSPPHAKDPVGGFAPNVQHQQLSRVKRSTTDTDKQQRKAQKRQLVDRALMLGAKLSELEERMRASTDAQTQSTDHAKPATAESSSAVDSGKPAAEDVALLVEGLKGELEEERRRRVQLENDLKESLVSAERERALLLEKVDSVLTQSAATRTLEKQTVDAQAADTSDEQQPSAPKPTVPVIPPLSLGKVAEAEASSASGVVVPTIGVDVEPDEASEKSTEAASPTVERVEAAKPVVVVTASEAHESEKEPMRTMGSLASLEVASGDVSDIGKERTREGTDVPEEKATGRAHREEEASLHGDASGDEVDDTVTRTENLDADVDVYQLSDDEKRTGPAASPMLDASVYSITPTEFDNDIDKADGDDIGTVEREGRNATAMDEDSGTRSIPGVTKQPSAEVMALVARSSSGGLSTAENIEAPATTAAECSSRSPLPKKTADDASKGQETEAVADEEQAIDGDAKDDSACPTDRLTEKEAESKEEKEVPDTAAAAAGESGESHPGSENEAEPTDMNERRSPIARTADSVEDSAPDTADAAAETEVHASGEGEAPVRDADVVVRQPVEEPSETVEESEEADIAVAGAGTGETAVEEQASPSVDDDGDTPTRETQRAAEAGSPHTDIEKTVTKSVEGTTHPPERVASVPAPASDDHSAADADSDEQVRETSASGEHSDAEAVSPATEERGNPVKDSAGVTEEGTADAGRRDAEEIRVPERVDAEQKSAPEAVPAGDVEDEGQVTDEDASIVAGRREEIEAIANTGATEDEPAAAPAEKDDEVDDTDRAQASEEEAEGTMDVPAAARERKVEDGNETPAAAAASASEAEDEGPTDAPSAPASAINRKVEDSNETPAASDNEAEDEGPAEAPSAATAASERKVEDTNESPGAAAAASVDGEGEDEESEEEAEADDARLQIDTGIDDSLERSADVGSMWFVSEGADTPVEEYGPRFQETAPPPVPSAQRETAGAAHESPASGASAGESDGEERTNADEASEPAAAKHSAPRPTISLPDLHGTEGSHPPALNSPVAHAERTGAASKANAPQTPQDPQHQIEKLEAEVAAAVEQLGKLRGKDDHQTWSPATSRKQTGLLKDMASENDKLLERIQQLELALSEQQQAAQKFQDHAAELEKQNMELSTSLTSPEKAVPVSTDAVEGDTLRNAGASDDRDSDECAMESTEDVSVWDGAGDDGEADGADLFAGRAEEDNAGDAVSAERKQGKKRKPRKKTAGKKAPVAVKIPHVSKSKKHDEVDDENEEDQSAVARAAFIERAPLSVSSRELMLSHMSDTVSLADKVSKAISEAENAAKHALVSTQVSKAASPADGHSDELRAQLSFQTSSSLRSTDKAVDQIAGSLSREKALRDDEDNQETLQSPEQRRLTERRRAIAAAKADLTQRKKQQRLFGDRSKYATPPRPVFDMDPLVTGGENTAEAGQDSQQSPGVNQNARDSHTKTEVPSLELSSRG